MFFALAAFLWLPAAAHCQLETVPGLGFLRCAGVTAGDHCTPGDCGRCCAVEQSDYSLSSGSFSVFAPKLVALPLGVPSITLDTLTALPDEVTLGVLVAAPPETFPTRHFLHRTALPVRAPSFAS